MLYSSYNGEACHLKILSMQLQVKALPKFILYGKYGTQSWSGLEMKYSTRLQLMLNVSRAHSFLCHIFHIAPVAMLKHIHTYIHIHTHTYIYNCVSSYVGGCVIWIHVETFLLHVIVMAIH